MVAVRPTCLSEEDSVNTFLFMDLVDSSMEENSAPMISVLQQFWDIESLGIVDGKRERHSLTFLPRITFKDNRYEVGLLWRGATWMCLIITMFV